ncbi:hypothetical protein HDU96_003404 [Phlyctochytrium bullatum]|nr:hypothetical protein HDU96_003404 [Phlyctochytrium bullatum]
MPEDVEEAAPVCESSAPAEDAIAPLEGEVAGNIEEVPLNQLELESTQGVEDVRLASEVDEGLLNTEVLPESGLKNVEPSVEGESFEATAVEPGTDRVEDGAPCESIAAEESQGQDDTKVSETVDLNATPSEPLQTTTDDTQALHRSVLNVDPEGRAEENIQQGEEAYQRSTNEGEGSHDQNVAEPALAGVKTAESEQEPVDLQNNNVEPQSPDSNPTTEVPLLEIQSDGGMTEAAQLDRRASFIADIDRNMSIVPELPNTVNSGRSSLAQRRQSDTSALLGIPAIAVEGSTDIENDGNEVSLPKSLSSVSMVRLSRQSSNSNFSSNSNISNAKRHLSLAIKISGSLRKRNSGSDVYISDNTTTVVSANYGTSFAGFTASAPVAAGLLVAHLPTTIHLSEKPSVASPHVMDPLKRNTLMGRRMDASQASDVVHESLLPAPIAKTAKAPSGTSGTFLPAKIPAADAARELLAKKLRTRKLNNFASIAFAAIRKMKQEKERLSIVQPDGGADTYAPPAPVTRVEVLNRRLPERKTSATSELNDAAWNSYLPVLKTDADNLVADFDMNNAENPLTPELLKARPLPSRPWTIPSQIPIAIEKPKVEIVSISLSQLKPEKEEAQVAEEASAAPAKKKTVVKKLKKKSMDENKSKKQTVLTKKGLKLEGTAIGRA